MAHRGATAKAPENTLAAFWRASELGADAVELDVRLSRDGVPVVYHYAHLDAATTGHGPIWERSLPELRQLQVGGPEGEGIPTLSEVLEALAGRLVLEIELKGPEPETVEVVGRLLDSFRPAWEALEVTSYEAVLLKALRQRCPGLRTALLVPRSEPWMGLDVVAYTAFQRARLAEAGVVHLHPSQLTRNVVEGLRGGGLEVHAWDVNTTSALELAARLGLSWVTTDQLEQALAWRAAAEAAG